MDDSIAVLLILVALAIGICGGVAVTGDNWANDCMTVGVHRQGTNVYKCERVK